MVPNCVITAKSLAGAVIPPKLFQMNKGNWVKLKLTDVNDVFFVMIEWGQGHA
jgi:hypothetical protein